MTRAVKRASRGRLLSLLSVLLVAGVVGGCSDEGTDAGRLEVDGRAEVARRGGDYQPAGDGSLRAGDRVKVLEGTAAVHLDDDHEAELRAGSEVELTPRATAGDEAGLSLLAGDLLVSAPGGELEVVAADVEVTVTDGSARLSRGLAAGAGSYSGRLTVRSAGRSIAVPALRQVSVPAAGLLPSRPSPLAFQPSDPWDQRMLGDAIELGNQLVARSKGFTAQLGTGEGRSPGFYRQILPALEAEPTFDTAMLGPRRDPGEALVGLAITVEGKRGSFGERVRAVFDFHDEGAPWGLVALDQGVTRAPLLAGVDAAIGRGPSIVAEGGAPPTPPPTIARPRTRAPGSVGPPRGSPPPTVSAPPAPAPAAPTPPRDPGSLNTGVPLVDNAVNSLVDLLSGLLGGDRRQ